MNKDYKKAYITLLANYGAFVKLVESSYISINKLANEDDIPIGTVVKLLDATQDLKEALKESNKLVKVC